MDLLLELSSFDTRGTGQKFYKYRWWRYKLIFLGDIMEFIKNNTELYNLEEWQIILLGRSKEIYIIIKSKAHIYTTN